MATVRRALGIALFVFVALAIFVGGWLTGRLGIGAVVDPASLTDVERQFTERMRDVTLVGSFALAPQLAVTSLPYSFLRFLLGGSCCSSRQPHRPRYSGG